ncbi:MAG: M15 family metallopeptidase [Leptospirales bacterium]|nr:M15 family metallopeptidase [Leptospirales bacterium]
MLKKILFTTIIFIMFCNFNLFSNETGIGMIPVFNFITGRFNFTVSEDFVNLKEYGIPCSGEAYLLREAADALKTMLDDFKKEHKNIKIYITSGTRNFYTQKKIWDEKWTGKRNVSGTDDITKITDPIKRALKILDYSSMPGTSRHHWGTDFDINQLTRSYYEKGEGKIIYQWLAQNASNYGFAQPFTNDRKEGYQEEKWHWSYTPLSKKFLKTWNEIYQNDPSQFNKKGMFEGSDKVGHLSYVYVNSISPECK